MAVTHATRQARAQARRQAAQIETDACILRAAADVLERRLSRAEGAWREACARIRSFATSLEFDNLATEFDSLETP